MNEINKDGAFVQTDDLYGKKINPVPAPKKEIGIDTEDNFFKEFLYSGESSAVDISKINSFSQLSQSREVIYQLLDTMAEDPTIASVLEIYAEDATESNDEGRIVWVQSDNSECSKYVTYLLDTMNVDKNIYKWTYSLSKYGDIYLRLYRESELKDDLFPEKDKNDFKSKYLNEQFKDEVFQTVKVKIEEYKKEHNGELPTQEQLKQLTEDVKVVLFSKHDKYVHYVEEVANPAEMFELTKFGKSYAYIKAPTLQSGAKIDNLTNSYYSYQFKKRDVEVYEPTSFVHGSLDDNASRYPEEVQLFMTDNEDETPNTYKVKRGQSLLYSSFKIWRQMMLLQNSLLLNRLSKSSILRVIEVEVGDMPKENVGPHLVGIKQLIEQKSAISEGNSLEEYTNPGPIENNIYVPIRNGMGSISTQQIGGDVDVKGLADIDYFQNLLYGALRVPKQFLGDTDDNAGFNGGTSLSIISSRYAKMVKRIQNVMIQVLTDAINLMLIDKGLEQYINKFELHMVPPTTQEDLDRRDNLSTKVGITRDIMDLLQDIEDIPQRLRILKSLLSNIINDPDIIDIIQEEIDYLQEQLDEQKVPGEEGLFEDELPGRDSNIPSFNDMPPMPTMSNDDLASELSGDKDNTLPTPADLDIGDLSDNNNTELQ